MFFIFSIIALQFIKKHRTRHPNLIIGIDFVGQEDEGTPLADFAEQLLPESGQIKFFFHAGETSKEY